MCNDSPRIYTCLYDFSTDSNDTKYQEWILTTYAAHDIATDDA